MKSTILKLGKLWKEQLEANPNVKRNDEITLDHPYIKAYEGSLEAGLKEAEDKPKTNSKKKKKVK